MITDSCLVYSCALCFVYRLSSNSFGHVRVGRCGARRRRRRDEPRVERACVCACACVGGGGSERGGGEGVSHCDDSRCVVQIANVVVHYQYLIVGPNIVFRGGERTHT